MWEPAFGGLPEEIATTPVVQNGPRVKPRTGITYGKVTRVISQSPDRRKDFEVNNLLGWFRKKSDLLANLKTELLFDIVKHLEFVTKTRDDVIIRQGEQGDCMYMILRGQVTIYIQYANNTGSDVNKSPQVGAQTKAADHDQFSTRKQYGTFVCSLGPGCTFGEVALLSDDCVRTATILVDESTDLAVVARALYTRSVSAVLARDFHDKAAFVAASSLFSDWAPRYRKQLTMALQRRSLAYDAVLVRQGAPVTDIFFVLRGEVKITTDPDKHLGQYPNLFIQRNPITAVLNGAPDGATDLAWTPQRTISNGTTQHTMSTNVRQRHISTTNTRQRHIANKQMTEICLLGVNESIGDVEALLGLPTYMQTAICTQPTDVLVLEMKHYERLLARRHPATLDTMYDAVARRLAFRLGTQKHRRVPLLAVLHGRARLACERRRRQRAARQAGGVQHAPARPARAFEDFKRGALVDMYGPGTVFGRIRKRSEAAARKAALIGARTASPSHRAEVRPRAWAAAQSRERSYACVSARDAMTSDEALTRLEERMRVWLSEGLRDCRGVRVTPLCRSTSHKVPSGELRSDAASIRLLDDGEVFTVEDDVFTDEVPAFVSLSRHQSSHDDDGKILRTPRVGDRHRYFYPRNLSTDENHSY